MSVGLPEVMLQAHAIQEHVQEHVAQGLQQVKKSLQAIVPPQSNFLTSTLAHSLGTPGKFLRPTLTLLCGLATGNTQGLPSTLIPPALIEVAAVSELIHIATLLHDDVLDNADLRRGKQTVSAQWGNKLAVLSGDYLLAQASLKLAQVGNIRLVSIYSGVLADLCDGEAIQMQASHNLEAAGLPEAWQSYRQKTVGKTASLFAAGCMAAGIVNQRPEAEIEALKTFGTEFGVAFQLIDDLLDYTASPEQLGKPVLDDLKNGILNAPVLFALQSEKLSALQKQTLQQTITRFFSVEEPEARKALAHELFELFEITQAFAQTRAMAQAAVEQAQAALDQLALTLPTACHDAISTQAKEALGNLCRQALSRQK